MKRSIEFSDAKSQQLTDQANAWARTHLVRTGRRGRPAVVSEYVAYLLDLHSRSTGALPAQARASKRGPPVRTTDGEARVAFARAWGRAPRRLRTFQEVNPIVRTLEPSADRPQRVYRVVQSYCNRRVLTPFDLGTSGRRLDLADLVEVGFSPEPVLEPRVDMVPDYHYTMTLTVQTSLPEGP